jgi:hypothetical protein
LSTAVESDIRYYRRRAYEEMAAASRAVTLAARLRRLQLVDIYVRHLKELDVPSPFTDDEMNRATAVGPHSAFAWLERARAN